ncbi:GIY-YIG nuclease family protein [Neptunomonas qingdaonensis]|uniref:Meiotically up-regulated gene 113 n=1 Tax=Neptunomonas qingdaonensis TaxID=1045558 RepID=A0A1I2TU11_9GAMM|nr:GIY-YIG nuclease family protein [Neptunomonas qingdaonensis]SFG68368.1 Meiotically up-regulated gene 113 [Neptunomonas qingdaonensis]
MIIPKTFFRVSNSCLIVEDSCGKARIQMPAGLGARLRPRHGLVIAEWNEQEQVGEVSGIGLVVGVNQADSEAELQYCPVNITLKPNPSGRRYWRNPFLGFAKEVVGRYMLEDLFHEQFEGMEDLSFQATRSTGVDRGGACTGGYVYVLKSDYGYKIGKTVNIKSRTRLFEVKLPFVTAIESYAWFDDYTQAESSLHRKFSAKRTEGEWFDLDSNDLKYISSLGDQIRIEGL